MGNFFSTVANLEYKSLTGDLPLWFVSVVFITTYLSLTMSKKYKDNALTYAAMAALGVMLMNYIQGQMYKARVKVYSANGVTNPKQFALRTSQLTMLSR
jgi:uncharacterized membrane protein (DUF485 family)